MSNHHKLRQCNVSFGLAIGLLAICLAIGYGLSQQKPLWNDEIYTQVYTLEGNSYKNVLLGRLPEGNNCPLFYLIQKGIGDLFQYRFPQKWQGEWNVVDARGQAILRLGPNVFMSLAIVSIFYFFASYYSWWAGIYALGVSLSSFMVWAYWGEARPYALWFFLTTMQSLLFLRLIREEKPGSSHWGWLVVTHWLLSFTVVFSIAQNIIVSSLLWIAKERNGPSRLFQTSLTMFYLNSTDAVNTEFTTSTPRRCIREKCSQGLLKRCTRYLLLTVVPSCIALYYYSQSLKVKFWFADSPLQLIYANIPQDRILLLIGYALTLLFYSMGKNKENVRRILTLFGWDGRYYLALSALTFLAAVTLLTAFKLGDTHGREGFAISSRYFIYLTPIGIIATTLFSVHLFRVFKEQTWMRVNLVIGLGGLLIIRFLRTLMDVAAL